MKIYCLVKNGEVLEGPGPLPLFFQNISNFNYLSNEDLKPLGWLPANLETTPGEVFVENQITITENEVKYMAVNRSRTEEEIKNISDQNFKSLWITFRQQRDTLLKSTDMYMLFDNWSKLSRDAQEKLTAYRQNLRDLPSAITDPTDFTFPIFKI